MISLGTLKTWDSVNYQAGVQLAGSITTYLDNIPVARNIAASQMVTGRHVLVAIPEDNPKDAIVLAVWGSSGPSFGDHGELAGLGDDDHGQYLNIARHDTTESHPLGTVVPHEPTLNNIGDVSVPTPADEDVIYWDNAESKWKCKQPSGGGASTFLALTDTPASYSGQAGKYPKVNAAQNALEFGQALDDHHARHEWLGADEIAIKLLMLAESYFHTSWEPDITWSTFTSGSGSVGAASFLDRRIATGATINSEAGLYIAVTASICPQRDGRPVMFFGGHTQPETDCRVRVYYDDGAATPPANTGKHIGWEVLNGDLYATHCDGVNAEVKTDTDINMTRYGYKRLAILGDATHSWFYVDGVLVATHTTNLAGYYNGRIWVGIKNTAAANKQWKLATMNFGYQA